jgi:DNA-binding SARP family transcriptional activator
MELRVLGPFDASDGGVPLPLGSPKPRALLARLVLDVNRTVATPRLVDDLWGEDVPGSATKMVQIYVSQLRKVLPAGVLVTRPPGYVVDVDPEVVDLTRFTRLRAEGRVALEAGDAATASARFRDGLELWRGPALAEFSEPFALVEAAHLDELRLVCLEDRIESDLALGRHADLVGELEALAARHPLRETLHGRLMLALYRSARQAEALSAYERFRRTLDDELGIEPSAALKALQHQILNQDPGLAPAAGTATGERPERPRSAVGAETRSPGQPAAYPAAPEGFVGRAPELRRLEAALDAAAAAQGGAVLIAGRAGIGKTHLSAELMDRARRRGASVLSGRCIQLVGSGLPYLPLVDALRPIRGSSALDELADELHELPRLVPDLTGRRNGGPDDHAGPDSRLRLFEEVLAVLERLSAAAPLVLVLEDLHWADESTLDLVAFLAHTVRDRRIVLVATYRSEAVEPGDHLHALASSAGVTSLQLEPLDPDEVKAMLAASGDRLLSTELLAAISQRSQGNPLFARELLAAATRGETEMPPALRDLLLASVARLDAGTRSVLRVVAAAGRDVPYGLLAAVMPLDELELAEALRRAVEHDVLVSDQTAGTFRFRHELFSEAVYGTLLAGERELLHERLARALTDEPRLAASGPGAPAAAGEAAQHWAAAGRPVEALAASLQAAREAEAVSGLTEALRHVERVLELWDAVPGAEAMAGVALPSVLAWAAELAGRPGQREDAVGARVMLGLLGPGEELDGEAIAARLGVTVVAGLFHASASLGIAESAASVVTMALASRGDPDARSRMLLAENVIALSASRATLSRAAALVDEDLDADPTALFAETQTAKTFVNEAAARIVDRALSLSGGAGYLNGHPLARAYRDVRAGSFMHPLGANRAYDLLGDVALGREPALH